MAEVIGSSHYDRQNIVKSFLRALSKLLSSRFCFVALACHLPHHKLTHATSER